MTKTNKTMLVIDVGNSSIHWSFINNGIIKEYKRNQHSELSLLPWDEIKKNNCPVAIAGMLPHMNDAAQTVANNHQIKFTEITLNNQRVIKNTYPTLGIDRVCNLISGLNSFQNLDSPIAVFDFGSATTITTCDNKGNFLGGMIRTGCEVELKAIGSKTLSLPHIELAREQKITKLNPLSRNTEDAILNGVLIGQVALIDYYLNIFKQDIGAMPKVIFTGGNSTIITKFYKKYDLLDQELTLKGIYHCYQANHVNV